MSRTPTGLRLLQIAGANVVGMRFLLPGGGRYEPQPGLALLTGRMLGEGTRERSWRQLAEEAERAGFSIAAYGDWDHHGLAVTALRECWDLAFERSCEILLGSAFDTDRFDTVRRQARGELRSLADQPDVRTGWAFHGQLYAPHPLARPLHGSEEDLDALGERDCESFHRAALSGGPLVALAGDLDSRIAERRYEELGALLPASSLPLAEPPAPLGVADRLEVKLCEGDQAHLFLGRRTVRRDDPDFIAMQLLSVILGSGAGLTGRLPERLREREGLAYVVYVSAAEGAGLDPGALQIYLGTSVSEVAKAERCTREELRRLIDEGPSQAELELARSYLLGRQPFRRETTRQVADLLAAAALYGDRSDDAAWVESSLREVSLDDLRRLCRRWLDPDELRVTVGLPAG